ncbi:MAG TPA: FHA domain-containing protein [Polyangiaceae bacterium]|nr:FHA domain-containing protein [Polyangiaceae bacterium]
MAQASVQRQVLPQRLMQAIVHSSQSSFVAAHGEVHYLAISTAGDAPELLEGLELLRGETKPARPLSAMAFKTSAGSRAVTPGSIRPTAMIDPVEALSSGHYQVVEIGKRGDLDGAFPERISVGRAANKDIVLRHESVSKFHGWFEVDSALSLYVVDAGSTNHTVVRSRQLTARAREPVPPGTPIRFGSIDTFVVDAESLWTAFRSRSA